MVIVRKGDSEKIKGALQSHCMETSRFQFIHIEDDYDTGTAESLKLLKGKTKVITVSSVFSGHLNLGKKLHSLI